MAKRIKSVDHALHWITHWNRHASLEIREDLQLLGAKIRHQENPGGELKVQEGRLWKFDWAVLAPSIKIAVEIDGGNRMVRWSNRAKRYVAVGAHTMSEDYEKRNAAVEAGWTVLAFTTEMLKKDPIACVEQVERVIRSRM